MTRTIAALLALLAAPLPAWADAVSDAMNVRGGAVDILPKPWPLKNLVKPGVLTVTVTGEAPPGDFIDPKTGELTGFIHDLYLRIGQDLGLPVEFVKLPFVSSLPGLKANRFDMACASAAWTTQRLASDDFHMTSPIALTGLLGLTRADSGITSWETTKGKRLGGTQGEIYVADARKRLAGLGAVLEFPGSPEMVLALQNGQVDVIVTNSNNTRYILKNAPDAAGLRVIGPAMVVYPGGMCVNPREADLLKAVDALLANYRADGTLRDIYVKYGVPPEVIEQLKGIGY